MSRKSLGPRRTVIIRVPEVLYAELIALHPDFLSPMGTVSYGAMQNYILSLITQDLERRKELLRGQVKA